MKTLQATTVTIQFTTTQEAEVARMIEMVLAICVFLWRIGQAGKEAVFFVIDITEATVFTYKVFIISLKALTYGLIG